MDDFVKQKIILKIHGASLLDIKFFAEVNFILFFCKKI